MWNGSLADTVLVAQGFAGRGPALDNFTHNRLTSERSRPWIMAAKDPRIDAYIAKSAPFAQPILKHLRKVVHAGCPDVEETIKWSMPHFDYKGLMCHMAAFKQHCAFGFRNDSVVSAKQQSVAAEAMGHFGRITALSDLPAEKVLIGYVRKAAKLNDSGVKRVRTNPSR